MLRRLGRAPDRRVSRRDRDRRQDGASILPGKGQESCHPYGFGLRSATAARARPGQGLGEVERDRGDPQIAGHVVDRRRHRDH